MPNNFFIDVYLKSPEKCNNMCHKLIFSKLKIYF